MGPKAASEAAQLLVENGCRALLSWGVAGALTESVRSGILVLPSHIVDAEGVALGCARPMVEAFHSRLPGSINCRRDPLAESVLVAATKSQKLALGRQTGAVATDMESAAIARVAAASKLPFFAVRVVIDEVQAPLPLAFVPREFRGTAAGQRRGFIADIPTELRRMLGMAPAYLKAKRSLKQAAMVLNTTDWDRAETNTNKK